MNEATEIKSMELYNVSMAKSLIDKIFFMDKIDDEITTIVDYGCADGALIKFLAPLFPTMYFVGYDNSSEMISRAKENNKDNSNVIFFDNLDSFLDWSNTSKFAENMALNLSSVIHEVYSYSSKKEIEDFWYFVNYSYFKYIIIRDMAVDENAERPSWKEDVLKVKSHLYQAEMIEEFESIHGPITNNKNLIHLLMKYRYTVNWDREVKENYLPISVEEMASKIDDNYQLIYYDHYVLPYLAKIVKEDFDITLKDYTHVKLIYRLRRPDDNEG